MTLVMYLHDDELWESMINLRKVDSVATIPYNNMNFLTKIILSLSIMMTLNIVANSSARATREVNRDNLCRRFPLNSRCEDYSATELKTQTYQLDRNAFCDRFALNSECQKPPVKIIRLNLDRSGENDEWVRIEQQDNEVKLMHTTRVKDDLISGALNGALGFVPFPLPFVEANAYNWSDKQMMQVSFKSDRCQAENCIVTGKNSLTLSQDADLYGGMFTIEYLDKDLRRSISFRVPGDTKVETIDTITVESKY